MINEKIINEKNTIQDFDLLVNRKIRKRGIFKYFPVKI